MSWVDDYLAEGQRAMGDASKGVQSPLGVAGILQQRRQRFSSELSDPRVRARLMALTDAEVGNQGPQAHQAFIETLLNRADARGKSLWDTMHGAYFPGITHQRTAARIGDPRLDQKYGGIVGSVSGGSNVANYATGNASGTVGFAGGPQTFSAGGERFGIEGPDRRWATEVRRVPQAPPVSFNTQGATLQSGGVTSSITPLDPGKISFADARPTPPASVPDSVAGVPIRRVQTVALNGTGEPSGGAGRFAAPMLGQTDLAMGTQPAPPPVQYAMADAAAQPQADWVSTTMANAPKPQLAADDPLPAPARSQSGLGFPGTRSALGGPKPGAQAAQSPMAPDGSRSMGGVQPSAWWENVNGTMVPKFLSDTKPTLPMPKAPDMTPKMQSNPFKSFFGGWF